MRNGEANIPALPCVLLAILPDAIESMRARYLNVARAQ